MSSTTLALGATLTVLEGLTYVFVAERRRTRSIVGSRGLALVCFVAFWYTSGANKILAAGANYAAAFDRLSLNLYVSTLLINFALLAVGLGCLLYYLLFLFTGKRRILYPVAVTYILYYFVLTYTLINGQPTIIHEGTWRISHEGTRAASGPLQLLNLVLLAVPQTVGALMLLAVRGRSQDPTLRYRLALVPLALVAWTIGIVLVGLPGFYDSAAMQFSSRAIGALAALITLAAYEPFSWVRRRYGVHGLEPSTPSAQVLSASR